MQILDFRFEPVVRISIIIVSYNVKYFLEQCLCSVMKGIDESSTTGSQWEVEVFVIDNNSADGSIEYLENRFPSVHFIANKENAGFAKANNQALKVAKGEYILFLNPDTILPEDFLLRCIQFMEANPDVGATGVRMIDGSGKFLRESKRGFPTSWASFCKLFGLTSMFPKSKVFSQYYLGHIDENTNHEVEALSGACMLVRREAIEKTGGFDERFFMYAEDIDLSYQISQLGYKNFYLADLTIIHFKGESTRKDSQYVRLFYSAMTRFVDKHYTDSRGRVYVQFLKLAIWSRALLSFGTIRLEKNAGQPANPRTFFFIGDNGSIEEVKSKNLARGILARDAAQADDIILCEGKHFSFKEMIDGMKQAPHRNYRIHSAGSSGIAGSEPVNNPYHRRLPGRRTS